MKSNQNLISSLITPFLVIYILVSQSGSEHGDWNYELDEEDCVCCKIQFRYSISTRKKYFILFVPSVSRRLSIRERVLSLICVDFFSPLGCVNSVPPSHPLSLIIHDWNARLPPNQTWPVDTPWRFYCRHTWSTVPWIQEHLAFLNLPLVNMHRWEHLHILPLHRGA